MATEEEQRYVYVMISQTPTGFGKLIRRFGGMKYNHTSISFDRDMHQLYGFARKVHRVPVVAGLVHEFPKRFSLNKVDNVPVIIYRIPVTVAQYRAGLKKLKEIQEDKEEYLYNLFSVITYPIFGGFKSYKAYTCSEFVVHLLETMNVPINTKKPAHKITPEQMEDVLKDYEVVYDGNLLEYVSDPDVTSPVYFQPPRYFRDGVATVYTLGRLAYRARGNLSPMRATRYVKDKYEHYKKRR